MQFPSEITFHNMDHSDAVETRVRDEIEKLGRFNSALIGCRVVVSADHKSQNKGRIFHTRINISVPGSTLVVDREPEANRAHEDVYVAVRDAFAAARRQLQDYAEKHHR
ncbi:HPF/RaiA family ribosome-associated protein [Oceanibacterium hippocampi]|uniref:Sigma 54 modulation protein / S30EA ribosomal protein n=1 Tax=Oceanibacterium hippocampi TaxID=745714 RepID=A0A1Y5TFH5_9PROT|nr:HPF/RaiA family ribosome-associated protein [Oceanibacterium hippocampi]SLN59126.1 Sigma 54 modulation protein / S30EA ribosomal protein [Oceanibacterium hippocampi]